MRGKVDLLQTDYPFAVARGALVPGLLQQALAPGRDLELAQARAYFRSPGLMAHVERTLGMLSGVLLRGRAGFSVYRVPVHPASACASDLGGGQLRAVVLASIDRPVLVVVVAEGSPRVVVDFAPGDLAVVDFHPGRYWGADGKDGSRVLEVTLGATTSHADQPAPGRAVLVDL